MDDQNLTEQENMSTEKNASSPFQNNTDPKSETEDFSIRTMKDDLIELSKKESSFLKSDSKPEEKAVEKTVLPEKKLTPIVDLPKPAPEKNASAKDHNPFLDQTQPTGPKKEVPVVEKKEEKKIEMVEVPFGEKKAPSNNKNLTNTLYKIVLSVAIILILSILGLGGYYFWLTKSSSQEALLPQTETPVEEIPVQTNEETTVTEPAVEKYSTQNPNYFPLDLSTMSDSDISTTISNLISELKEKNASSLYEFIPVDKNNNPIAFPIFATAAKFNLSPTLLSTLGETSSFYIYNDNGVQRVAFAVDIKRQESFTNEITKQQPTLIKDASFLFFGATPETTTGKFSDGKYGDVQIKFINLNKEETLSIDYTTIGSQFVMGTSKNTLRAVIDKLNITKTPATGTNTETEQVTE